jgi:hypothetical protein
VTAPAPFSQRTVLALLAVGAGAFLLLLYALGAGWTGNRDRDGGAHAAANGLNGFAGLAKLLEASGETVELSRSEARLDDKALLVLTPQLFADAGTLSDIIEARRYIGPTLVILPKWAAGRADRISQLDAPDGWVVLGAAVSSGWIGDVEGLAEARVEVAERKRWNGLGLAGVLPAPDRGLALVSDSLSNEDWTSVLPLVTDAKGDVLAGYLNDAGDYPMLDRASGYVPGDTVDKNMWPVVIVAEPDLMNNYGLADRSRAQLALAIVEATLDNHDLPLVFDLTLAGLGGSRNLLTLAFAPPFLAATLCLILAAVVIAWRALRRFGPPV